MKKMLKLAGLLLVGLTLRADVGFSAAPTIVLIAGEEEYKSKVTLPAFGKSLEREFHCQTVYLEGRSSTDLPGLEALDRADLVILFARRMTLPEEQLSRLRRYFHSGKAVIGIRTASHAFQNWLEFDRLVLGGNYHGHHSAKSIATAEVNPDQQAHPILKNVPSRFVTGGSLYRNSPLGTNAVPLLFARIEGKPSEPVAWTHRHGGARVFYTSLGHPKDFENPAFRRMLINAIHWALDEPLAPKSSTSSAPTRAGQAPAEARKIELSEFEELRGKKEYIVLDVRTPKEFAAGHVPGAIHVDWNAPDFEQRVAALDPEKPYLVHCNSGRRSARAVIQMRRLGFSELYDFSGGWQVWKKSRKPADQ